MIRSLAQARPVEMFPGVTRRTLHYGAQLLMVEIVMAEGAVVPWHSHPHEQLGTLLHGRLLLAADGQPQEATPGDSWLIAGGVSHMATALAPCVMVEAFSPPREDYKDQ